jgi:hypothetical protein
MKLRFNQTTRPYSDFRSETHQQSGKRANPALRDRGGKKQKQKRITVKDMCTFRELQQKLEKW